MILFMLLPLLAMAYIGWHIWCLLPVKWYFKVMKYERYIMLGLMAVILFESYVLHGGLILGGLSYLSSLLINGMLRLLELLPFFG